MITLRSMHGIPVLSLWLVLLGCAGAKNSMPDPGQARIDALERENATLRMEIARLEERFQLLEGELDFIGQRSIDGVILDIDQNLRLVTLSKGRRDGVKVGYVFDVYLHAQYKGQLRVQDVLETTCSAVIVHEMNPMAEGDSATTSL